MKMICEHVLSSKYWLWLFVKVSVQEMERKQSDIIIRKKVYKASQKQTFIHTFSYFCFFKLIVLLFYFKIQVLEQRKGF